MPESASRYLVDFSVGDHPGVPTTGTRRFGAWIFSAEGVTAKVQEFTVPKGSQHIVLIVEATGAKPSVTLALLKDPPRADMERLMTSMAQFAPPQFIFYFAEITRLKWVVGIVAHDHRRTAVTSRSCALTAAVLPARSSALHNRATVSASTNPLGEPRPGPASFSPVRNASTAATVSVV